MCNNLLLFNCLNLCNLFDKTFIKKIALLKNNFIRKVLIMLNFETKYFAKSPKSVKGRTSSKE